MAAVESAYPPNTSEPTMPSSARVSWISWLLLTVFAWFHATSGIEGMPAYLATHFDGSGQPNGWMSPSRFLWFMGAMWAVMTLSFWGPRFLFGRLPSRWLSLPKREYWLSPERRGHGIDRVSLWIEGYGAVMLVGLIAVNQLLFAANSAAEPSLPSAFVWGVFAYLAGTGVWIFGFIRAFKIPAAARTTEI
jgi:hypothetical protein